MKHQEFIDKMDRIKPIFDRWMTCNNGTFTELGDEFDLSPTQAWSACDYYRRHKDDPRWPELSEETHESVMKLSKLVNMATKESLRKSLCDKFMAQSTNGSLNHKADGIRQSSLVKLMDISGLKWFYLDGNPKIHWEEKP